MDLKVQREAMKANEEAIAARLEMMVILLG
jgi:hypothetical protein